MKFSGVLFFISIFLYTLVNASYNDTDWLLITNENGIMVFERWVKSAKNQKVRERSGRMNINCDATAALMLIADANRTKNWMSNVENVEILKQVSQNNWYQRTVLNTPWPFNKQDMVSEYLVLHDTINNIITVKITPADNIMPKQKGIDRLNTFTAEWQIEQTKRGNTKITFTTSSTVPPEYPVWVQDPVVRKVFLSNLRGFKKELTK